MRTANRTGPSSSAPTPIAEQDLLIAFTYKTQAITDTLDLVKGQLMPVWEAETSTIPRLVGPLLHIEGQEAITDFLDLTNLFCVGACQAGLMQPDVSPNMCTTPEGTAVRVGARRDGNQVTAWVEDAGPGLPEGDAVSIFERFKRGGSQEPEPGGLGLGLWISRSIVERHGGTITAARTDDDFTRFSFTLPVEPGDGS